MELCLRVKVHKLRCFYEACGWRSERFVLLDFVVVVFMFVETMIILKGQFVSKGVSKDNLKLLGILRVVRMLVPAMLLVCRQILFTIRFLLTGRAALPFGTQAA